METKTTLRPSPTALLNPRSDPAFKAIFTQGTEQSELALKSFLSAMIGRTVVSFILQPNEPAVDSTNQKQMSFDVSVTFDDGELADIEMQRQNKEENFGIRSEGQAARLLNSIVRKSNDWNLKKVYQISILDFEYDKDDNSVLSWYTMKNANGRNLGGRLNVIYLDLTKIRKLFDQKQIIDELKSYEKWGLFFAYEDDESKASYLKRILESEKGLMAAHNTIETMSKYEDNWAQQFSYETAILDYNTDMNNATKKGIAIGLEQGAQQKAIEAASNLLRMKIGTPEQIAQAQGLPLETVLKLQKEITVNA